MPGLGLTGRPKSGLPLFSPPAGNVITNWAGTGTGGTGGLPDGWTASSVAGVAFSVIGRTPYRGGQIIEFQFAGTATGGGSCMVQPASNIIGVAAPGQVWRMSLFSEALNAAVPGQMMWRLSWRDAALVSIGAGTSIAMNGALAGPALVSNSTAPANTAYCGPFMILIVSSGQVVNLRYKVFAPTMWRVS